MKCVEGEVEVVMVVVVLKLTRFTSWQVRLEMRLLEKRCIARSRDGQEAIMIVHGAWNIIPVSISGKASSSSQGVAQQSGRFSFLYMVAAPPDRQCFRSYKSCSSWSSIGCSIIRYIKLTKGHHADVVT